MNAHRSTFPVHVVCPVHRHVVIHLNREGGLVVLVVFGLLVTHRHRRVFVVVAPVLIRVFTAVIVVLAVTGADRRAKQEHIVLCSCPSPVVFCEPSLPLC